MLQINQFTFGPFGENTYVISNAQSAECIIIDPGCSNFSEKQELADFIIKNSLKPQALVNTHCHIDHILGNRFIFDQFQLKPLLHQDDLQWLNDLERIGQVYNIPAEASPAPERYLIDQSIENWLGHDFKVIHTPGHSLGSISLVQEEMKWVIAGDVLFSGSIGRTDLPGGNHEQLLSSIQDKLMILPDAYQVWSGHGPVTTIGKERKSNPFLQ